MTVSSLATITSNYGHLNGIDAMTYGGYGGYGLGYGGYGYGGVWGTANAEQAKERVKNNYDVNSTWQGYRSKQGVESLDHTQQCLLMAEDLKHGETDQVSERFRDMLKSMKNMPQYTNYADTELCSLIRNEYATATGSDLVVDINKNASGAFIQGFKRSIPILGLMANKNSKADLVSQVTENNRSRSEKTSKILGSVTGAAAGTSAIAAAVWGIFTKGKKGKSIVNYTTDAVENFAKKGNGKGKMAMIAVAATTALAFLAALIGSHDSKKNS